MAAAKQSKQRAVPEILPVADYADVLSPEAVVLSHTGASGGLADRIVGPPRSDAPDRARAGVLGGRARAGPLARRRGRHVRAGRAAHRDGRDRRRGARAARDGVPGMTSFAVEFLGCKVSLADAQAVRERLAERRPRRGRRRRGPRPGGEHLLRHRRGGGEVAQGRAPGRADGRPRARHRLRRQPARCRPGRRRERHGAPGPGRAAARRGRRAGGRARLHGRRRAAVRAHPRLREGAGRLLVRLHLLRDPAGARREPQPRGRRGAGRGGAARRPGPPRGRPDRHQPGLLPRPRRRHAAGRPAGRRRRGRRASSGCGSPRSR